MGKLELCLTTLQQRACTSHKERVEGRDTARTAWSSQQTALEAQVTCRAMLSWRMERCARHSPSCCA